MDHIDMDHGDRGTPVRRGGFFSSRWNVGLVVFLVIAGYFLITEHQAHLSGLLAFLPFLLLLACPLMHFFMHGGHGGHGGHGDDRDASGSNRQPGGHRH
jgi:hypothetical protein